MTHHQTRLAKITFWLVFGQAIAVIILLFITLQDVAARAEQAAESAARNELVLRQNRELIQALEVSQAVAVERTQVAVESIFCLLLVPPGERTDADVVRCSSGLSP